MSYLVLCHISSCVTSQFVSQLISIMSDYVTSQAASYLRLCHILCRFSTHWQQLKTHMHTVNVGAILEYYVTKAPQTFNHWSTLLLHKINSDFEINRSEDADNRRVSVNICGHKKQANTGPRDSLLKSKKKKLHPLDLVSIWFLVRHYFCMTCIYGLCVYIYIHIYAYIRSKQWEKNLLRMKLRINMMDRDKYSLTFWRRNYFF